MKMKVIISEETENGWEIVEKIIPYSKEGYKEYCQRPELASIEIIK